MPLVIVMVTGELVPVLLPLPLQEPLVVTNTARPELACAATLKVVLYMALAGAGVSTVIVWLFLPTVIPWVTGAAAL